jgi:hypothetical protein
MLALASLAASAGGSLALATPAYQERGEGGARDEPHVEPRAPRDASAASLDATERDLSYETAA